MPGLKNVIKKNHYSGDQVRFSAWTRTWDQQAHYCRQENQPQGSAGLIYNSSTVWQEEAGAQNPVCSLGLKFRKERILIKLSKNLRFLENLEKRQES